MKKLFIALSIVSASACTPTVALSREKVKALIQTIIGGGTVGLTCSLLQNSRNNIVLQGAQHLYAQAGFGSCLQQIRLGVQQLIAEIKPGSFKQTLKIERGLYAVAGILGAYLAIEGLQTLLHD